MKANEFCRNWFKATPEQESSRGYRQQCVTLLAKVLGVKENTIQRWGSGVDFEKMPEEYEVTLAYADTIRAMLEAAYEDTRLIEAVFEKLKNRN
ncbi:hypothetical protein [Leptolyngbya sp. FACHB-16]|uniref:hypothetical protein n=1 Tax=unclassified Leptolyngbya TaxID=2650499 RepID=UPI001683F96D|nr:hypothetical protein [Leptolyngbya sp. FACHB-16]MBD2153102.1 hypothetical protein [Leptolyngbya sp. FACHB-16]